MALSDSPPGGMQMEMDEIHLEIEDIHKKRKIEWPIKPSCFGACFNTWRHLFMFGELQF